jgi:integrase
VVRRARPLAPRRTARTLELWQRQLESNGYAPRTIAIRLTALASFYRYCENEEVLTRSPMARVRRPRVDRRSPRSSLIREQLHDLLDSAHEQGPHPFGLLCLLAFNGLRITETTSLDVTALDYDGLFPILRLVRKGGRPRGRSARTPDRSRRHRPHRRPSERNAVPDPSRDPDGPTRRPTHPRPGGPRAARTPPHITPHVLGHTWTTRAIDAGVPHDQIQHDGGWSDARMVAYYTHGRDNAVRAATHSVAAYVLSAAWRACRCPTAATMKALR